jgi:hypothetical protein
MEQTVESLLDKETNMDRPGMLLGKIQGGKTRAFIGVIALAFDNDYDMAIILTKGTKALARQTYQRLNNDFADFIESDKIQLFDILKLPENLPKYVLRQKLVMIVKKETNNLARTIKALVNTYPDLCNKKILIIDDEADYASIGFKTNRADGITELRKIASQIDILRKEVQKSDFLQVTATPYSLYLQPEEHQLPQGPEKFVFRPIRPAFTILLPDYHGYIGGDFYFLDSQDANSIAGYVYHGISDDELCALEKQDGRSFKLDEVLTHKKISALRKGILNFIIGSCIRRIQQKTRSEIVQKYSFVIHTESRKQSHDWQQKLVEKLKELLVYTAEHNTAALSPLITEAYSDLSRSIDVTDSPPPYDEVFREVLQALTEDYLMIIKVNSENEAENLLDANGELKLRAPLNIFIGGQILDRGITIKNLIGFYYGRTPLKFQQDTVLQHSRMFGNRSKADLTVTRFYTSFKLYSTMERINEFDDALRQAFEKAAHREVVFIRSDATNKIVPCNPNKILISRITTLKPGSRILPVGFQTGYKTKIEPIIKQLDELILSALSKESENKPFLVDLSFVESVIDLINSTLELETGSGWDVKAFKAGMAFLSINTENISLRNKIWCIVRRNRDTSRFKSGGVDYSNAPDSGRDELPMARDVAQDIPALILLNEIGSKDKGWMGSPFWWPVLVPPRNTRPVIYAEEQMDLN